MHNTWFVGIFFFSAACRVFNNINCGISILLSLENFDDLDSFEHMLHFVFLVPLGPVNLS